MQKIIKNIVWVCLAIIPFVVLHVADGSILDVLSWGSNGGLFFPFISGKNIIFRILVEIALAGWAILALYDPSYRINIKKSPIIIAYGLFILVLLIANIFGVDPQKSLWSNFERMEGFVGHIHFFAYFFVLTVMIRTLADWQKLWKIFIAADVLVLIYAYGQLLGAKGLFFSNMFPAASAWFSSRFAIHMSQNRLDATIGNSAYFAIFCLMYIFIIALLWSQSKEPKKQWLYPVLIALNTIALLYSGTRGTMIGLIVGGLITVGVFVFRWADSRKEILAIVSSTILYVTYTLTALLINNSLLAHFAVVSYLYTAVLFVSSAMVFVRTKDTFRRFGAVIFMLALAAVVLFQGVKDTSFVKSSSILSRIATISPTDITGASRLAMWEISYKAWLERPVFGYGQDNFSYIFARKFLPERMCNLEPWYDRSHNVFFDWLVAAGALGLITYLSLYVVTLWFMWKKDNGMPLVEKALLTGMLAGYFIHNFFVFDNLTSYILFFTFLAYITVRAKATQDTSHAKPFFDKEQMNLLVIPVIAIVLVVTLYYVNYRPLIVNRLVIKAMSINQYAQTMPFNEAVKIQQDAFTNAIAMNTLGSLEAREQFLQMAVRMGQIQIPAELPPVEKQATVEALNNLMKAAREEVVNSYPQYKEDVRMLSIYGMFFNGVGDAPSAEEALTQALTLAPNKQLLAFDLTRSYLIQKKFPEAYALGRKTYDLSITCNDAMKWYLMGAAYAGSYKEAAQYVISRGQVPPLDPDVISGIVSSGQIGLAIEILQEAKIKNPELATQIDDFIKQLLGTKK